MENAVSAVYFECDDCDERIFIEDGDIDGAISRHLQTSLHLETVATLRAIQSGGDIKTFDDINFTFTEAAKSNAVVSRKTFDSNVTSFGDFKLFFCKVCQVNVNDSAAMLQHTQSEKHNRLETFIKELYVRRQLLKCLGFCHEDISADYSNKVLAYFSNLNLATNTRHCLVCDCIVPYHEFNLKAHVNEEKHRIKLNSLFVTKGMNSSFYCFICNEQNSSLGKLNEHVESYFHQRTLELMYEFAYRGVFF